MLTIQFGFGTAVLLALVAVVFIWLAVQLVLIGHVSWMLPAVAIIGLFALALARALPGSNVHRNSPIENP
jgi:hypothetical protein